MPGTDRLQRFAAVAAVALGLVATVHPSVAAAAESPIALGDAGSYGILAGSTVTNTGPSVVDGDLGLSPGSAVVGFPPGDVTGETHVADAEAVDAKADLVTAYDDAASRSTTDTVAADLGGQTLVPGVYAGGALAITGTLTLDAEGDPDAVFVFKAASSLVTASASSVALIGDADACNVFWQVTSSATLGTGSDFAGTILALSSITANTGASIDGRLLARNAAVTLDTNAVTVSACAASVATTTTSTSTTTSSTTNTTQPVDTVVTTGPDDASSTVVPGAGATTSTVLADAGVTTTTAFGGSSIRELPRTGSGVGLLVLIGLACLAIGTVATSRARAARR